ncbi:MAG: cysteine desulfurase family protein [Anaerovoracaceae bacterium]|jgi:cysteine desulfurase
MIVYLDNSATTRQYDQVTKEMTRMMDEDYGNPSSLHRMGMIAERAVKQARKTVAASLGVREETIYFTGSGTEADNTAIFGAAFTRKRRGNHIITSKVEHPAVLEVCRKLERIGYQVDYINVNEKGLVDIDEIKQKLNDKTILVTVMYVNNELGTVQPISEIGKIVKTKGDILFHSDAVQAYGKIPLDLDSRLIDLLSISGHKIHGPKGTGALYVKRGLHIEPYLIGGGQERGFRSGTENTPGIVGFGLAAEIMNQSAFKRIDSIKKARNYLLEGIKAEIKDIHINSPETVYESEDFKKPVSSPSILNVSFLGCRGEVLLHSLEQQNIYVSTGSACSSKKKGSHVLEAAGLDANCIDSAIRFSFSEFNTIEQMDYVLEGLKKAVDNIRKLMRHR